MNQKVAPVEIYVKEKEEETNKTKTKNLFAVLFLSLYREFLPSSYLLFPNKAYSMSKAIIFVLLHQNHAGYMCMNKHSANILYTTIT